MDKTKTEDHLRARLTSKEQILKEGGQQALSHSPEDLERIQCALQRLRTNSYGACIDCGNEIDHKRLEAIPEAERCIDCQQSYENNLN